MDFSYYKDFIENNEGKSFIEFSKTLIDQNQKKPFKMDLDESKLKGYNFYFSGIFGRKNNLIPSVYIQASGVKGVNFTILKKESVTVKANKFDDPEKAIIKIKFN